MDIFDQAQELERLARETALQRARSSQYWEGPCLLYTSDAADE